jgi:hypothetical protein
VWGDGVLGLRQINTCRKVPLQAKFFRRRHFTLPSVTLIFLRPIPIPTSLFLILEASSSLSSSLFGSSSYFFFLSTPSILLPTSLPPLSIISPGILILHLYPFSLPPSSSSHPPPHFPSIRFSIISPGILLPQLYSILPLFPLPPSSIFLPHFPSTPFSIISPAISLFSRVTPPPPTHLPGKR